MIRVKTDKTVAKGFEKQERHSINSHITMPSPPLKKYIYYKHGFQTTSGLPWPMPHRSTGLLLGTRVILGSLTDLGSLAANERSSLYRLTLPF